MSFLVDFGTGNILDGEFEIGEAGCGLCNFPVFWFEGDLSGNVDTIASTGFTVSNGKYTFTSDDIPQPSLDLDLGTAKIFGDFTGDPANDDAWFAGTFYLETADNSVNALGSYAIGSFMEDRLTTGQLLAMENNVGLLINPANVVTPVVSSGSDLDSPAFGQFLDFGFSSLDQDAIISDEIHEQLRQFALANVIVENFPGSINEQSNDDFNVGWGYWDTGADQLSNKLNGDDVSTQGFSDGPLYWLSAEPTDIANLDGEWRYSGVTDFVVNDNDGNEITSLDMGFDVNFADGAISNGFLEVISTAGTWDTNFNEGSVHGAYATMSGVSGTYGDSTSVTGDIKGVFVGTGANQGFAAGFTLDDNMGAFLGGAALINSRSILD
jgi:hypothetical protein